MTNQNELFPIFLKLENLNTLIVGGGNVALEKLNAILKSSPNANIDVVATDISNEILALSFDNPRIKTHMMPYHVGDLEGKQVVILATDNYELHKTIKEETTRRGILTNVADTPELCDFYLGSIVTKGDLKIGISTNGMSPTLAKRIRQYLEEALPDETQSLIANLNNFRKTIKGDFAQKVKELNELTSSLITRIN